MGTRPRALGSGLHEGGGWAVKAPSTTVPVRGTAVTAAAVVSSIR
jgi:hypothetical protein